MIGDLIAVRYEIQQELETSPLFASYRALDRQSGKEVRLRILEEPFNAERKFSMALKDHAEQLQPLVHPSLERVLDVVEDEERLILVSEYVPSSPMDERVRRLASFSVQLAVGTAVSVSEALMVVHQAGFVHGDISGRNVLVTPSGMVKLSMSGFWTTYPASSKAGLAMLRGMAPYLAPEVTAGGMPSRASDIYAVGVLIYQMLAGRCPFGGDSTVAIATKHATAPYPSVRSINPSVPPALDEVIRKCMAKSPSERYASVNDLLSDLRSIQDALRFGRPLTWPLRAGDVEAAPVAPVVQEPAERPKQTLKKQRAKPADSDGTPRWLVGLVYLSIIGTLIGVFAYIGFITHRPKLIDMPNIRFKTQAEAAMVLNKLGLRMSVERNVASDKYPSGVILDQDPEPGRHKVKENGIVQVVLSAGGRFVEVPDLRGMTIEEARKVSQDMDLDLSETIDRVRDKDLAEGLIVSQNPEARKKIERGSKLRVKVSNGDKSVENGTTSSDRYTYKLKVTMPPGAAAVLVRIDMTDDRQTRTIHEKKHEPSETFDIQADGFGKEVTFRVFFDGDLIDQVQKKADEADALPDDQPADDGNARQ
ncbi:MAG: PASTA domain-containing protein [Armatimonadetes bacterium]|nr:PASTA domain-containing protein [Armatimonadota bacterium]